MGDVCAAGGQLVEAGVDNGADGGTAGDGVLQDGEVTASEAVCNGVDAPVAAGNGCNGGQSTWPAWLAFFGFFGWRRLRRSRATSA